MNEEIYDLAEAGQFDDAPTENDDTLDCNKNDIIAPKFPRDIKIQEPDDYEDSTSEYDDVDYMKFETNNTQCKAMNGHNYDSWADKMDLLKIKSTSKATDKSDNATYDRVLDDRSRKIMFKMMRQNVFSTVKGNISAGKEANVYYAPTADGQDLVLKVYMTSIMPFKARDKYMNGDFRFRNANTSSSTKLVTTWAEKEFRNLLRISETNGAIPCPKPIKQKGMVLAMSMIGKFGEAAPKLKDLIIDNDEQWCRLYQQVLTYVRILFQQCRLIHADLSEYNLLYHDDKVWMIDVSQSVEHFHPEALNFLRKDCHVMNTFFRNKGIKTVSLREFFDFVVDPDICQHTDDNFDSFVREMISNSEYSSNAEEDDYFLHCHIPRNLSDVVAFVKDYKKLRNDPNNIKDCVYASVTGMTSELKDIRSKAKASMKTHKATLKILNNGKEGEPEEAAAEAKVDTSMFQRPTLETKEDKKSRKKLVKEAQREKRVENKKEEIALKARTIPGFKNKGVRC